MLNKVRHRKCRNTRTGSASPPQKCTVTKNTNKLPAAQTVILSTFNHSLKCKWKRMASMT